MFCIELHACDNFLELQLRQGSTTMDISKLMAPPTVFLQPLHMHLKCWCFKDKCSGRRTTASLPGTWWMIWSRFGTRTSKLWKPSFPRMWLELLWMNWKTILNHGVSRSNELCLRERMQSWKRWWRTWTPSWSPRHLLLWRCLAGLNLDIWTNIFFINTWSVKYSICWFWA